MPAGRLNAQNTRGPQGDRLCCSVVRTPVRTGDETGGLLGTAATVGHNRLQCLALAYRRYHRTHTTMISASKWRPANNSSTGTNRDIFPWSPVPLILHQSLVARGPVQ